VTPLRRYVAEEIATDHADGLLTRREAVRRLALLGVGAATATELRLRAPGQKVASSDSASAADWYGNC
jgi:carboxymethylenebutenolidase